MLDIKIINGKIIDGTGSPFYFGEVGLKNDKIVKVGYSIDDAAKKVINAKGKVIAPGFIDAHSHSDFPLLINRKAESKIRMGVTSEVIGQCGNSAAPRTPNKKDFFGYDLDEIGVTYDSMEQYLQLLETKEVAVNVIPLVGHGNIRTIVMGESDRKPTDSEMEKMKKLLDESLQAGAYGMSTGLIYPPGCYSEINELIELSHVLHKYNAFYVTHMRNEESKLLQSIKEVLEIAKKADIAVHISHFKSCNEENWGLVNDGLRLLEEAREDNIDVTADQYPYIASSTSLKTLIPQWAHDGGVSKLRKRVLDKNTRLRIREEIIAHYGTQDKLSCVMVSSCQKEKNKKFEGLNLIEISNIVDKDPVDACLDLLLDENFSPGMVRFSMSEEDVKTVMNHHLVMIGSDASCMASEGALSKGKPHPRAYGTFARVIGKYAIKEKLMPLEKAIFKMTGMPATRFMLQDRGLIKENMYADITIFDENEIIDSATFKNPHNFAKGIDYVIVNGEIVIENGTQNEKYPGKVLRRR
ncbi:MAG: N-acyl-D-amino-acid deacylase family protein [Clostridia bacterium]